MRTQIPCRRYQSISKTSLLKSMDCGFESRVWDTFHISLHPLYGPPLPPSLPPSPTHLVIILYCQDLRFAEYHPHHGVRSYLWEHGQDIRQFLLALLLLCMCGDSPHPLVILVETVKQVLVLELMFMANCGREQQDWAILPQPLSIKESNQFWIFRYPSL